MNLRKRPIGSASRAFKNRDFSASCAAVPHWATTDESFTGCGKTHALYQGTTLEPAGKTLYEEHGVTGCGKTHVLYQGTTLEPAGKTLSEEHGVTGCGKTHVLYQGTTLVGPYTMG